MSILIKGAKMPKWCIGCPCCDKDLQICEVLKKDIPVFEDKLPDCPLVEIPPHGRLIDADRLLQDVSSATDHVRFTTINNLDYENAFEDVAEFIAFAPIVIESEEE